MLPLRVYHDEEQKPSRGTRLGDEAEAMELHGDASALVQFAHLRYVNRDDPDVAEPSSGAGRRHRAGRFLRSARRAAVSRGRGGISSGSWCSSAPAGPNLNVVRCSRAQKVQASTIRGADTFARGC